MKITIRLKARLNIMLKIKKLVLNKIIKMNLEIQFKVEEANIQFNRT